MKKSLLLVIFMALLPIAVHAQTQYYITGTAVPNGEQPLVAFPDGQYKYAGTLYEGTLCVNSKTGTSVVRLLKPKYEDSYIVNHGIPYTTTSFADSLAAQWVVPFCEERYRFTVDTKARTITGELFTPWDECFMVGGATECAWETYTFLPFTRDENEICVWTWIGELKYRSEHSEPSKFKIMGQNAWEPKSLHPYTNGEDILTTSQVRFNNGTDYKWSVRQDGYYSVRVDIFRETCEAKFLGTTMPGTPDGPTGIEMAKCNAKLDVTGNLITATCSEDITLRVFTLDGNNLFTSTGTSLSCTLPHRGVYVIHLQAQKHTFSRKVVF